MGHIGLNNDLCGKLEGTSSGEWKLHPTTKWRLPSFILELYCKVVGESNFTCFIVYHFFFYLFLQCNNEIAKRHGILKAWMWRQQIMPYELQVTCQINPCSKREVWGRLFVNLATGLPMKWKRKRRSIAWSDFKYIYRNAFWALLYANGYVFG